MLRKLSKGALFFLTLGIILFTIHWKCAPSRPCVNNRCVLLQCKEGKPDRAPLEDGRWVRMVIRYTRRLRPGAVPTGGSRDDLSRRDAPVLTRLHAAKEVDRVKVSSF
ncbi:hypothetical protein GQ607_013742 [Colletotrichum asianum]|uniref:Uncharacterized protein n=1 Tax=Colletotrichum asianum TaxID=702518 RepID=A0A8H3ZME4_9PEZI|nr:hypothetical protein GQ607_013742 [Colletotrichum asianum]